MGADAAGENMYRAHGFISWRPCASAATGKPKFKSRPNRSDSTLASRGGALDDLCSVGVGMAGKSTACRYVGTRPGNRSPIDRSDSQQAGHLGVRPARANLHPAVIKRRDLDLLGL